MVDDGTDARKQHFNLKLTQEHFFQRPAIPPHRIRYTGNRRTQSRPHQAARNDLRAFSFAAAFSAIRFFTDRSGLTRRF
jgi:hypothetical protein